MLVSDKMVVVRNFIESKPGHVRNRWDNVHFESNGKEFRFKFMTNVIRKELKVRYDDGSSGWIRVKTYNVNDAYKNIVNKGLVSA